MAGETAGMISDGFFETVASELAARADPKKKAWWERYMRGVIPFHGVGIPDIREIVVEAAATSGLADARAGTVTAVAARFMARPIAEEKLAGVLTDQIYAVPRIDASGMLAALEPSFDSGHLFDWNTVDWVGIRILTALIDREGDAAAEKIADWTAASGLWKARVGLVAFAYVRPIGEYRKAIYRSAGRLIRREERFAKTAVGWVLRELLQADAPGVVGFLEDHAPYLTREVIDNTLKHYPVDEKRPLRKALTARCLRGRGLE